MSIFINKQLFRRRQNENEIDCSSVSFIRFERNKKNNFRERQAEEKINLELRHRKLHFVWKHIKLIHFIEAKGMKKENTQETN